MNSIFHARPGALCIKCYVTRSVYVAEQLDFWLPSFYSLVRPILSHERKGVFIFTFSLCEIRVDEELKRTKSTTPKEEKHLLHT